MFVTISDELRAQLRDRADRLAALLPPARAAGIRAMMDEMNRLGGLDDAKLTAFRHLLAEYCRTDDGGSAPPEEESSAPEDESRDRRAAFGLARLLMIRMQTLLERADMAQRRRNIILERKR